MSKVKMYNEKVAFGNLGRDIKESRKAMGITRATLAEMLNIDIRYLANIENYGQMPSLSLFYRLVVICNLPINQYFFNKKDTEDNELQLLLNSVCNCPKQYRTLISSIIMELRKIEQTEE